VYAKLFINTNKQEKKISAHAIGYSVTPLACTIFPLCIIKHFAGVPAHTIAHYLRTWTAFKCDVLFLNYRIITGYIILLYLYSYIVCRIRLLIVEII